LDITGKLELIHNRLIIGYWTRS